MRHTDRHRRRPEVESLESVVALSSAAGIAHAASTAVVVQRQAQAGVLRGTLQGGYALSPSNPDTGKSYHIGAVGRLTPIGQSAASAQIQSTGFIANGMASGTMTLSARRGNLKLQLTGPTQSGFAPLPGTFNYRIVGGTRSYRNVNGSGTVLVTLHPSFVSDSFGTVTISFRPGTTSTG